MHELSVCLALVVQVERIAQEQGSKSVLKIVLKVGPLSGVEPDLLRHAYPLAVAGTVAAGAELVIEDSAVIVRCNTCDKESSVAVNRLLCSHCGDFRTRVVQGEEMVLQSVELEKGHALRDTADTKGQQIPPGVQ